MSEKQLFEKVVSKDKIEVSWDSRKYRLYYCDYKRGKLTFEVIRK